MDKVLACPRCFYVKMTMKLKEKVESFKDAPGVAKAAESTLLAAMSEMGRYPNCICGINLQAPVYEASWKKLPTKIVNGAEIPAAYSVNTESFDEYFKTLDVEPTEQEKPQKAVKTKPPQLSKSSHKKVKK